MYEDPLLQMLCPKLCQFAAVAREEHVTRAANRLGIPQPTLSRAIAGLESGLGVPLFVREGRQIRLTGRGRALLTHVERALAELEDGLRRFARDEPSGEIVVAFLPTLGAHVVPAALRAFTSANPLIRVRLSQAGAGVILQRLRDGEVDVCITSPLPDVADVSAREIYREELVLTVPPRHPLATRARVHLGEAAGEEFVGFAPGYGLRRITERLCRSVGFHPRLAFEGEDVETVRGLVAAGLGIALLPAAWTPRPDVVELAVTEPRAEREIGVAWRSHAQPPRVMVFCDFLLDHPFGRQGPHG